MQQDGSSQAALPAVEPLLLAALPCAARFSNLLLPSPCHSFALTPAAEARGTNLLPRPGKQLGPAALALRAMCVPPASGAPALPGGRGATPAPAPAAGGKRTASQRAAHEEALLGGGLGFYRWQDDPANSIPTATPFNIHLDLDAAMALVEMQSKEPRDGSQREGTAGMPASQPGAAAAAAPAVPLLAQQAASLAALQVQGLNREAAAGRAQQAAQPDACKVLSALLAYEKACAAQPCDSSGASDAQRHGSSSGALGGSSSWGGNATPACEEGSLAASASSTLSSFAECAAMPAAALVSAVPAVKQEPLPPPPAVQQLQPQMQPEPASCPAGEKGPPAPPVRKRQRSAPSSEPRSGQSGRSGTRGARSKPAEAAGPSAAAAAGVAPARAAAPGPAAAAPAGGDDDDNGRERERGREREGWRYQMEEITLELCEREGIFDMNQGDAAQYLGMGTTTIKTELMPRLGLSVWPYRKRHTAKKCVLEPLEEYVRRYGSAACEPCDRWKVDALLAHVRAEVTALCKPIAPTEMSKDIRALRQVLYKLDAEKINRTPDDPKWRKDIGTLLKKWVKRFGLQPPADATAAGS